VPPSRATAKKNQTAGATIVRRRLRVQQCATANQRNYQEISLLTTCAATKYCPMVKGGISDSPCQLVKMVVVYERVKIETAGFRRTAVINLGL
jgi:hypothetical protein